MAQELTWLLVQLTYWPQPVGYPVDVPGILPEGAEGVLPSLVQPLVNDTGFVPRREMTNPEQ